MFSLIEFLHRSRSTNYIAGRNMKELKCDKLAAHIASTSVTDSSYRVQVVVCRISPSIYLLLWECDAL